MTDRPVHEAAQLLVGAVGCWGQRGLGGAEVLQAGARDGFPKKQNRKQVGEQSERGEDEK